MDDMQKLIIDELKEVRKELKEMRSEITKYKGFMGGVMAVFGVLVTGVNLVGAWFKHFNN